MPELPDASGSGYGNRGCLGTLRHPFHLGRCTHAWEVRVHKGERLAALFLCTQMVLRS